MLCDHMLFPWSSSTSASAVVAGLCALHKAGVVHGDVVGMFEYILLISNVFLTDRDR